MKFCVDCKWLKTYQSRYYCVHPSIVGPVDLVTGEVKWRTHPANEMRQGACGKDGALWGAKLKWWRLVVG